MVRQQRLHFFLSKIFLAMCLASGNLSEVEFATRPRGLASLAGTGPHLLNLGELQKVLQCDAPLCQQIDGSDSQSNDVLAPYPL